MVSVDLGGVPTAYTGESDQNIEQRIQRDFDALIEEHASVDAIEFNDDTTYKQVTTDAITAKSLALKKLRLFVGLCEKRGDGADAPDGILRDILSRPIADFARDDVVMELKTGIYGFPWAQVMGNSASVDFGEWPSARLNSPQLETLTAALWANEALRTVTVGGGKERLVFNGGWATAALEWDASAAVQASTGVTALLLRCFTSVTSLSLR